MEYGIYEVHYDKEHAKIEEVHAYIITDNSTDGGHTYSRDEVISKIENNNKVITLIQKDNGNWKRGAEVIVFKIDNEKYVKTESNTTKKDNLGELPEY